MCLNHPELVQKHPTHLASSVSHKKSRSNLSEAGGRMGKTG